MNREYDLIIYGASGFTGRLAVEYLDENYSDLNWAIAGRDEDKLVNISKIVSVNLIILLQTVKIMKICLELLPKLVLLHLWLVHLTSIVQFSYTMR